jgi:hypothetical protein
MPQPAQTRTNGPGYVMFYKFPQSAVAWLAKEKARRPTGVAPFSWILNLILFFYLDI